MGFSPKEEVVKIADQDELGANLPISAGSFGAKLSGEFERGQSIDIAMMMIGKHRTTVRKATRGELVEDREGACAGATHFVRGATVGAFAMTTGSNAEMRTAAQLFGIPNLGEVGLKGGSKSSKDVSRRDGEVDVCKGADVDGERPPGKCGALLRLELTAIDPSAESPKLSAEPPSETESDIALNPCPSNMVLSGGKCTSKTSAKAYRCKLGDVPNCEAQCEAGNAESCTLAGMVYGRGTRQKFGGDTPIDLKKAVPLFRKGCDGGDPMGCLKLGQVYQVGAGVAEDHDKARELYKTGCDAGFAAACTGMSDLYALALGVKQDHAQSARYARLACNGGHALGCFALASMTAKGEGVERDIKKAAGLFQRVCEGGQVVGCLVWGQLLATGGDGLKADKSKAKKQYQRACVDLGATAAGGCKKLKKLIGD
jgi:TPR repeat protein